MKKLFLILLAFCISTETFATTVILRPSLIAQMQRQEGINRANYTLEKKLNNQMRLAEIRAERQASIRAKAGNSIIATQVGVPAITPSRATPSLATYSVASTLVGVDMDRVRSTWMSWYDSTRSELGLSPYSFDSRLDVTAHDWNIVFAEGKGQNHHRRNPTDSYYDFPVIDAWFGARGISPKVVNRAKNTENVGYGYYSCSQADCTDELISSIRSTYNFFMSEKGKSYDAHYRSIVQPYFTKIGMDIIVVPSEKRYYITIHYITE